jgi:dTDP-4-dehydrorhamnose reductase
MRAVVLGAEGQLGFALTRLLPGAWGFSRGQVSVTDQAALRVLIDGFKPEVVFNCAAYNAVDRAESEPDLAYQVNADGPLNAALACRGTGAHLVHFSTNFVFDGELGRAYVESDEPAPLGAYARSKLEGERRVLEALPTSLVIRTAAVFGHRPPGIKGASFPDRILALARRGEPLKVVADQKMNPTYAADLAGAAVTLAEARLDGIAHVVAAGCCGWDEFARAVLDELDVGAEVRSIDSSAFPSPARRPLNGCLRSVRVAALRPWREGLADWARSLVRES